jgi:hypothetical protein
MGVSREQGHQPFADETFGDLFGDVRRRSMASLIVATGMGLPRIDGGSDWEAIDGVAFDLG